MVVDLEGGSLSFALHLLHAWRFECYSWACSLSFRLCLLLRSFISVTDPIDTSSHSTLPTSRPDHSFLHLCMSPIEFDITHDMRKLLFELDFLLLKATLLYSTLATLGTGIYLDPKETIRNKRRRGFMQCFAHARFKERHDGYNR